MYLKRAEESSQGNLSLFMQRVVGPTLSVKPLDNVGLSWNMAITRGSSRCTKDLLPQEA